jgi:hypothetical protein
MPVKFLLFFFALRTVDFPDPSLQQEIQSGRRDKVAGLTPAESRVMSVTRVSYHKKTFEGEPHVISTLNRTLQM